jgi:beta-glucanase (GH16 family)
VAAAVADRAHPGFASVGTPPGRGYSDGWLGRKGVKAYAFTATLAAIVFLLSSTTWTLPMWLTGGKGPEGVHNGSAEMDLTGWSAASDTGTVTLTPVRIGAGPEKTRSAVDIQRKPGTGKWTMVLTDLVKPEKLFRVGHRYQMRAYARDLNASGDTIGMLLANDNHLHQPTEASRYVRTVDSSWHLLVRTFVAQRVAYPDTRLYFALPALGALHWQITAASVREIPKVAPRKITHKPVTTMSFDGPAGAPADPQVWNHELGGNGWGNGELQTYTDSTGNAQLDGAGNLVLTARRQDATGPDGIARKYTSARITTQNKVIVHPRSYVEASVRAPGGRGVWPAFWLLGTDIATAGWPGAGELDVLEVSGAEPTVARSRIHVARADRPGEDAPYPLTWENATIDVNQPLDRDFHTYGVYFDGTTARFYVDRKQHLALDREDAEVSGRAWPFGKPMYMILNVAVNYEDPNTVFPQSMVVNRISVWKGGTPF